MPSLPAPATLPDGWTGCFTYPMPPEANQLVTVVIPAYNEECFIDACLDAVRAQSYRDLQIVVIDGGSTDDTVSVVKRHQAEDERIELLHNPRRTITTSLNLALAHARGRWLVRVDAHSTVGPAYIRLVVARLREARWGGVGGRKDGAGITPAGRAIAAAMASPFGVGGSTYHHGTKTREVDHIPFGAYPVELVRSLGGWDERLVANEDFEFDHRLRQAGLALLFDPQIVINWRCRQSIRDLYRQYWRYGSGKVDVAFLHPESLRPRHVLVPAFAAYAAIAGVIALRRPRWSLMMIAPYALGLSVASVWTARSLDSAADRIRVAPAFLAMHLGWGGGFWSRLLTAAVDHIGQACRRGR